MVLHRTLDNRNVAMTTPTFCIQIRRVKGRWLDLEKRGGEGRGVIRRGEGEGGHKKGGGEGGQQVVTRLSLAFTTLICKNTRVYIVLIVSPIKFSKKRLNLKKL